MEEKRKRENQTFLQDLQFKNLSHLGSGTYGDVFTDGKQALKVIQLKPNHIGSLLRELSVQKDIASTSPYLARLLDFKYYPKSQKLVIQMPLADGDLRNRMNEMYAQPPFDVFFLVFQLFCGLHTLHHAGIAHFDVKPENILLFDTRNGIVANLSDFGLATFLETANEFPSTSRITQMYRPPEMLQGFAGDEKADIWSMGLLVAEMIYQCIKEEILPLVKFLSKMNTKKQFAIVKNLGSMNPIDIINFVFNKQDPDNENLLLTIENVIDYEKVVRDSSYILFLLNLLPLLLQKDPKKRPSAFEVLNLFQKEAKDGKYELPPCSVTLSSRKTFDFKTSGKCVIKGQDQDKKTRKEMAITFLEQSLCERMGDEYDGQDKEMKHVLDETARNIYSYHFFDEKDLRNKEFMDRLLSVMETILTPTSPLLPLYSDS